MDGSHWSPVVGPTLVCGWKEGQAANVKSGQMIEREKSNVTQIRASRDFIASSFKTRKQTRDERKTGVEVYTFLVTLEWRRFQAAKTPIFSVGKPTLLLVCK